ncbi:unnamed protein product [Coffea canephora]|uniref:DUF4228 domain-containing protein n=1 Tax=Coffea canephora TaxID=49390 RepID=A0A068V8W3_COFCA|nr:unnamed protein product [Coffea canephora]
MGNCQAIDNASLLIQHPNGRVDKLYLPVTASEIMKMNPGHYVALLLTTTICPATSSTTTTDNTKATKHSSNTDFKSNSPPVRITRIKLLRPTDSLVLGHVYRLITTQEVMKGLWAKKYAKMRKQQSESSEKKVNLTAKEISDFEAAVRKYEMERSSQTKHERHRTKTSQSASTIAAKSRAWQPSLQSISEAAS